MSEADYTLHDALKTLQFPLEWLTFGVRDSTMVINLAKQYRRSEEDHYPEHYRYRSYMAVLARGVPLADDDLRRFIELAAMDEDREIATATLIRLIKWEGLANEQLNMVSDYPAFRESIIQQEIRRKRLAQAIRADALTDEIVRQSISSGDAVIQRMLLDHGNLARQHIEALREQGVTRAIRNIARQKSSSRASK